MAKLDARTDDFIRTLLDVCGRARPADIHGVSPAEATALLQAYASAHSEQPLAYSDGVLSVGASPAAVAAEPEPEPAAEAFSPPAETAFSPENAAVPEPVAVPEPEPAGAPEPAAVPVPEPFVPQVEPVPVATYEQWTQPAPGPEPEAVPQFIPAPAEPFAPTPESWAPQTEPATASLVPEHEAVSVPAQQEAPASELPSWVYEQQAPAPVSDDVAIPAPSVPAPAPYPPADSVPAAIPAPVTPSEAPAPAVDGGSIPAPYPTAFPAPPAPYGEPATAQPGIPVPAPTPDPAWPAPDPAWPAPDPAWAPQSPAIGAEGDWQAANDASPMSSRESLPAVEPSIPWYWWLVPFFFSWLGGLVAWLSLKSSQPRNARKLLIFGLIMVAVEIALFVMSAVLGAALFV